MRTAGASCCAKAACKCSIRARRAREGQRLGQRSPARAADIVLHGGRIITVDPRFSVQEAVALSGNRIVFVGGNAEALRLADARTRTIDLRGRAVMPGLIDGHAHMDREGLKRVFPSLADARSIADVK